METFAVLKKKTKYYSEEIITVMTLFFIFAAFWTTVSFLTGNEDYLLKAFSIFGIYVLVFGFIYFLISKVDTEQGTFGFLAFNLSFHIMNFGLLTGVFSGWALVLSIFMFIVYYQAVLIIIGSEMAYLGLAVLAIVGAGFYFFLI